MAILNDDGEVRAAGGAIVRDGGDGLEVLLVHRPKYDDWTLPKGKAEPGESDEECARREVLEETGLVCELERELPAIRYVDRVGRAKVARYWRMRPVGGEARPQNEVDDVRWLPIDAAIATLSYDRDIEVLRALP